jgi:hypothetical protein
VVEQTFDAQSSQTLTGFEQKTLRVVIENWLYHEDLGIVMDAATELRRRFSKTFPRPAWTVENYHVR